ncbi:MAG: hypothetical protein ACHQ06_04110 [Candidatus Dormibacteria bacterium]|jgi:hypothetical protein
MGDGGTVGEVVVEVNPSGASIWRARVDALNLVVGGDTVAAAEAAALAAVIEAGGQLADDLVVRVRFGTRSERLAAGWVPQPNGTSTVRSRPRVHAARMDGSGK